ncbi:hypothetical protein RHMOL_Rhmol11G0271700 [Rhododendron molle]|uniref:Uncharacterized protein n=1 Tax=Rhododendron molle TaxID=49168 RepID=A0ACC0LXS2_RHOML|nr:hypothetical protein RHMOL_Rhmol11G0271700 [Rhododendron molle]
MEQQSTQYLSPPMQRGSRLHFPSKRGLDKQGIRSTWTRGKSKGERSKSEASNDLMTSWSSRLLERQQMKLVVVLMYLSGPWQSKKLQRKEKRTASRMRAPRVARFRHRGAHDGSSNGVAGVVMLQGHRLQGYQLGERNALSSSFTGGEILGVVFSGANASDDTVSIGLGLMAVPGYGPIAVMLYVLLAKIKIMSCAIN